MIFLKTQEEIAFMKESNSLVGKTLGQLAKHIQPGVSTISLDNIAEAFIRDNGALPGFLGYQGYPYTLCISINENVVHGMPSSYCLQDGDIVSIDCGVLKNGYYGDSAYTFCVGNVTPALKQLLAVTKASLYKGIEQAKELNRVGDIGYTIQGYCESYGYSVVRELTGHGIGRHLHEEPSIPNYGRKGTGPLLKKGMVIAIEPMINMGSKNVVFEKDGWTVRTKDRKPSAHFEHTIVITEDKPEILSSFDFIEEILGE